MRRIVILCVATAAMAHSAAAADRGGCAVPVFGADKAAVILACTSALNQSGLSDADRVRALITRGRVAHMLDNVDAAILDFDQAIKLAPSDPEPLVRRAQAAYTRRNYDRAYEMAKWALELDANNAMAFDVLGDIGAANDNFKMAKPAYDKAIELQPNDVVARYHRFQLFERFGLYREAVKELDDLLALRTPDLETRFTEFYGKDIAYRTIARLKRAAVLEVMGRLQDSLNAYNDFVQAEPGVFSYGWRGEYHLDRSEFDLAQADLDKALSYVPDLWIVHYYKGRTYLYQERYDDAVASLTRAIALEPDHGSVYWTRSLALRALHRTSDAQRDALKAFRVDHAFFERKIPTLIKLGYYQPATNDADRVPAVRDAVDACMLDERCW